MTSLRCNVCFRHCLLEEGRTGPCRVRKNEGGRNICLSYGKITSAALDPIEKKPLARFYPGSMIFSIGSFGCNLDCPFCQNYEIAGAGAGGVPVEEATPERVALAAEELRRRGNIGAAYTYNEPMIGWEFVRDCAKLIRERGMKNVVVTNGSVTLETLDEVLPLTDAWNIDLKCFTEEGYGRLGGDLETVKAFIGRCAPLSHVELTTLVVPGLNDGAEEIEALARWIASIDKKIPLHLTRFFPRRLMSGAAPTDLSLLRSLAIVARKHLDDVTLGNI